MVRNGLLKDDSKKGIWEISEKGRGYFKKMTQERDSTLYG